MLTKSLRSKTSLARPRMRRSTRERAAFAGGVVRRRTTRASRSAHRGATPIVTGRASARLLARLDHNEEVLRAFNRATLAVDQSRRVTPAAEWLLDNFYLIEEQIQMARRHLPRAYSRELPRLTNGPSAGLPARLRHRARIDLARGRADRCRIAQRLRRCLSDGGAAETGRALGDSDHAAAGVDRESASASPPGWPAPGRIAIWRTCGWIVCRKMAEKNPSRLVIVVADMAQADLPLSSSFVAEFCQRLSRLNPGAASRAQLARATARSSRVSRSSNWSIRKARARRPTRFPSATASASLRFLSAIDWKEFVETLSLVEQTLRGEPADVYGEMDFATRDRYRHVGRDPRPVQCSSRKPKWRAKPSNWRRKARSRKGAKIGPRMSAFT